MPRVISVCDFKKGSFGNLYHVRLTDYDKGREGIVAQAALDRLLQSAENS